MKRLFLVMILTSLSMYLLAQSIPQVQIKDLNGKTVSTKKIIENDGKPIILSFFATWCKPCVKELTAFSEELEDWTEETGVKIIAISIDNARSSSSVAPFINARGWDFEVYLDENGDFKRAMNVGNVPHTFVIDGKGKVVWQHTSYLEGDEAKVHKVIQKVAKGEAIK